MQRRIRSTISRERKEKVDVVKCQIMTLLEKLNVDPNRVVVVLVHSGRESQLILLGIS